ncbi:V-type ATPase subunit a family protein [Microaerobacter geothermalis]|uniref:V-type ATPase subunit a family protein n=1 Tax=Microaerobacter geothermalis TaxID=674972 RepID=UPI001F4267FA|nr:V-type ATPase subunit a family protein [Microaerobacter geothermalis]MCF6093253.1 V-type ATPase subunit a family protein [Microaerobacter geothermalis]
MSQIIDELNERLTKLEANMSETNERLTKLESNMSEVKGTLMRIKEGQPAAKILSLLYR